MRSVWELCWELQRRSPLEVSVKWAAGKLLCHLGRHDWKPYGTSDRVCFRCGQHYWGWPCR